MKHFILPTLIAFATPTFADSAKVIDVEAIQNNGTWSFSVTLEHADTGWDHYADGWGVYLEDGTELGYRVLHHPHVNEQPFTRSLQGVKIPEGVLKVVIKPRDSVHGVGDRATIELK